MDTLMCEERLYKLVVNAQQHVLSAAELDRDLLSKALARVRQSLDLYAGVATIEPGTLDPDWPVQLPASGANPS